MIRPRPLTFRARLTLRWTVLFGLLLALANLAIYVSVWQYVWRDLRAKLRTLGVTELASALDGTSGIHIHEFPAHSLGNREFTEKFVQIYDEAGQIVMQSRLLGETPRLIERSRLQRAYHGRVPQLDVLVQGRPARMVVLPAPHGGRRYTIGVGLFTDQLQAGLTNLAWLLGAVWLFGLAATAGIGFALSSTALRPVEKITRRAASIASGDFAARLDPPATDDELGRMTRSLNGVLERLHAAVEANRRFAADASHELRGPITAMAGEIDVTLKHERTAEEYRETLSLVRERLDTLVALTEDLMVLVRAQESSRDLALREIALVPLITASASGLKSLAVGRGITLKLENFPALVAYSEPRLLARVFDNVLGNAVRYNREGGEVVISGSFEEPAGDSWQAGVAIVRVRDTGAGIREHDRERVFERFYRVDQSRARQTGGTGLGLAICREVLTVLGGTIRVADSSGEGTVMEVRLPGHRVSDRTRSDVLVSPPQALRA